MNIEEIRDYCLSKKSVEECFPFGDEHLVFKVGGKIFAILGIDEPKSLNLKCDPELAIGLREMHSFVLAGYHMNKTHWNTIDLSYFVDSELLIKWIDHSYQLIVNSLSKKVRTENNLS